MALHERLSVLPSSDFTTDDDNATYDGSSISTLTSFDTYFLHASRPSRTSSNVFSHLVQPLSVDEYTASLSRSFYPLPFPTTTSASSVSVSDASGASHAPRAGPVQPQPLEAAYHRSHLPRYLLELAEGFNLIFYGFGSKRHALNDLARACATATPGRGHGHYHTPPAHVLVLNGFLPSFSARDIIATLARLPGAPQGVQGVAQFLVDPLADPPPATTTATTTFPSGQKQRRSAYLRRLVLVIHNMDAPALRAPKTRALLAALASLNGVQIAASVDHINAPLLWRSTELLAGRWLWHDLTTLAAYDAELAGADPASLRGVPALRTGGVAAGAPDSMGVGVGVGMGVGVGGQMTETAARHVLAAVTQRARKLFVLMGRRQLDALADVGSDNNNSAAAVVDPTTSAEVGEVAIGYDMLFNLARDHFVATNDTALRALLGEFKDHGLVVTVGTSAGMGSGERLWIPLRKERLTKLLDSLEQGDPP
jgi:origin recognition complex subunit 2